MLLRRVQQELAFEGADVLAVTADVSRKVA
jgi:hypothetical protein